MNLDETELPEPLFEARTPLGTKIRTHSYHWFSVRLKHPNHDFLLDDVVHCIQDPDIIRRSLKDDKVRLSYKKHGEYLLVAIYKSLNGSGFLMTCYLTDKIKRGETLWQK